MATIDRIIPLLVYDDIAAAHDFLVETFGFTSGYVHRDDAGNALHAEVRAGGLKIWLHRVAADFDLVSPRGAKAVTGGLVVHVADVDAHYAHALGRGARVDGPPSDKPYGQREYGARDAEGHRWWFATPLK